MAKVAFLGLGVMGYPMAGHLKNKGGHEVTVYNRTAAKAEQWVKQHGGKSVPTPKAAAEGQDFVMACVGNDNDLREVTLGPNGAFAGMGKGKVFVDHTTASAEIARELYASRQEGGFDFIDAPVSGGQAGAENGALTVMCGGDGEPFARAEKVIAAYARACNLLRLNRLRAVVKDGQPDLHCRVWFRVWPKVCTSHKSPDLDIEKLIATISKGAAQSWQMENRYKTMAARQIRFRLCGRLDAQGSWDLSGEARKNGAHLPVTSLVDQFYSEIQAMGGKRWDTSSLIALLNRLIRAVRSDGWRTPIGCDRIMPSHLAERIRLRANRLRLAALSGTERRAGFMKSTATCVVMSATV